MMIPTFNNSISTRLLLAGVLVIGLSACTNGTSPKSKPSSAPIAAGTSNSSSGGGTSSGSLPNYKIANHQASALNGSDETDFRINVDQANSYNLDLRTLCAAGCFVRLNWEDGQNPKRQIQVTIPQNGLQSWSITVRLPKTYKTEILPTTPIDLLFGPLAGNTRNFTQSTYRFTKQGVENGGDFQDDKGRSFVNLYRYACFDQFYRGKKINNFVKELSFSNGSIKIPLVSGSNFCFMQATASGGIEYSCESSRNQFNTPDYSDIYSSQSYYYNLYIRSNELGAIINSNDRFLCPNIIPSDIQRNLLTSLGAPVHDQMPFPLDSSFSLATSKSTDFSVGVEAYSRLGVGPEGDLVTRPPPTCSNASNIGTAGTSDLARACLGFAAKPDTAGFCPKVKIKETRNPGVERTVQTYRLRRYVMTYPVRYNTNGYLIENRGADVDEVFVLDRPAEAYADGMPSTMAGPKPCPQSYFDNGATGMADAPRYRGVNNPAWNGANGTGLGVNVDGIRFPNFDKRDPYNNQYSCAATLVLPGRKPSDNTPLFTLGTIMKDIDANHPGNAAPHMKEVQVRPQPAWTPRWEEDKEFVACAPQSTGQVDPPIEVAQTSDGDVSWCASIYPTRNTQNSKVYSTEPTCRGDQNTTCPREAYFPGVQQGQLPFKYFPLAAPQSDIRSALSNNPAQYGCKLNYVRLGGKADRLGKSPVGGCCRLGSRTVLPTGGWTSDHMEPDEACGIPIDL